MFPAAYEMQDCATLNDYLSVADSLNCLEDFKRLLVFDALIYIYIITIDIYLISSFYTMQMS